MTDSVNESAVFNDGPPAEGVRNWKMIIFGVCRVNRLVADTALSLRTLVDYLLFRLIEEPLGIESNADLFDNFGPPLVIIFRDRRSRRRLSSRSHIPVRQNVGGKLLREGLVEFE